MILISILIPSIPERIDTLKELLERLGLQATDEVEIIALTDNKKISIGAKRNRLKNMAQGKYFCFVDDDDDVADDYVEELLKAAQNNVDVIVFDTFANIDGTTSTVFVDIENLNEQYNPGGITNRRPSHVNAWLTSKFRKYKFSDKNYGEDFDFCNKCYKHVGKQHRIEKVLHYYTFDPDITQAL